MDEAICLESSNSQEPETHKDIKWRQREIMLSRLSQTDAHFKHQQRGEADLSCEEKKDIANSILDKSITTFLARFGSYLQADDLEYFSDISDCYEAQFYLKQIKKEQSKNFAANRVKNRRYEAMKQLQEEGEYFSEDSMKHRDPYLYEQLIGQYLTQEEVQDQVDKADLRFSTILLKHMDQLEENQLFAAQRDKEDSQMEEEDDDSDEEEEDDNEMEEGEVSTTKKAEMREEFYRIMQERFLAGKDQQFDYSQVDHNTAYDDLDLLDQDEEEKYFDSEQPDESSVPQITCLANTMQIDNEIDSKCHSEGEQKLTNTDQTKTQITKSELHIEDQSENIT